MKRVIFSGIVFFNFTLMFTFCTTRASEPIKGPLELDSQELALGQKIFNSHCNKCHPGGEAGLGPAINDRPTPGFLYRFQIRNGLGAMPGFSREVISNEEMDALIKYIHKQRGHS
jgi:mono/diheme cytochrome c family protein